MLSPDQMGRLKRVNVSKDAEKSKKRLKEAYSSASKMQKHAMVELSGLKRTAFYHAYSTGVVSARIVMAISQIMEVTPFYYTGEQDTKDKLQDGFVLLFLQNHGYRVILAELGVTEEPKAKRPRRKKAVIETSDIGRNTPVADDSHQCSLYLTRTDSSCDIFKVQIELPDSPDIRKGIDELDFDESILLLRALFIRGMVGGKYENLMKIVKRCLLA